MSALTVAVTLAAMLAPGGSPANTRDVPTLRAGGSPTAGLNVNQLAGQRMVTGFRGKTVPASVARRIKRGRLAGVILYTTNIPTVADAERLVGELRSIPRPPGLRQPLLVMVDQEGGQVKRLPGPPSMSAAEMGAAGRRVAAKQGRKTGRMMRGLGFNLNLAPVLDIGHPGGNIAAQDRAFGSSPGKVSNVGNAFAAGLEHAGVAAGAKHFPGVGRAALSTDTNPQTIGASARALRRDERPFRDFRGRVVMLSLAVYPAFDPSLPAALSRAIATRELRRKAGFRGVSISDALDVSAANAVGDTRRVARLAAKAGTDVLLLGRPARSRTAARELAEGLRNHSLARGKFEQSVERVLELRASLRN